MPANFVITPKNAIDDGQMTASPVMVASLPPSNLQLPARGRVARTIGTAAQQIKFTWGGAGYYLTMLMLSRHNLEPGSTWRIQLYSDAAWTTQVYDSGTISAVDSGTLGDLDFGIEPLGAGIFDAFLGQKYSLHYLKSGGLDTRVLAVSGIVTITNVGNSAGYLEFCRLFAGDHMELNYNPSGLDLSWDEVTDQSRSAGGSLRSDGKVAYRRLTVDLSFVNVAQRSKLMDLLRYAGKRKEVFIAAFPEQGGELERDYTFLGKFVGASPGLKHTGSAPQLSSQFVFEES